jgi:hypothetical protein
MTDRKLRLFAVACCRRLPGVAAVADDQAALAAIERFTDGEVGPAELRAAAGRAVCPSVAEAARPQASGLVDAAKCHTHDRRESLHEYPHAAAGRGRP